MRFVHGPPPQNKKIWRYFQILLDNNVLKGFLDISENPSECSTLAEIQLRCFGTACPEGDLVLNTQLEVDAFAATFSSCDTLPE